MSKAEISEAVDEVRWKEAQQWERAHWLRSQRARAKYGKNWIWRTLHFLGLVDKYRGDDWNLWWRDQFDNYKFLPVELDNAIEVGCGPYTNMRHILKRCSPKHLFLSDPLIKTYIAFELAFTADAYRRGFCILDDHPLEEIPYRDNYFDLVVMINVLDHVRDAGVSMDNAIRILRPGGFLILGQDLTNEDDLNALSKDPGLVGHPVKLPEEWFRPYLTSSFHPVLDKVLSRNDGREPSNHYATLVFSGTKI
jgi:SAM-dependent methyltransferase